MILYYDLMSQPSRAVYLLLKATNTNFTPKLIGILRGDQMKPSYLKINPWHKVPVIVDGDFTLTESVAQLRYIASTRNLPESWYPRQDARMTARCDEFLNWHHTRLRKPCIEFFMSKFKPIVKPDAPKMPGEDKFLLGLEKAVTNAVKEIDEHFLQGKKFILGDEISAADLIGYCELAQLRAAEAFDIITSNENVSEWIKNVEARLGAPLVEEASYLLNIMKKMFKSKMGDASTEDRPTKEQIMNQMYESKMGDANTEDRSTKDKGMYQMYKSKMDNASTEDTKEETNSTS